MGKHRGVRYRRAWWQFRLEWKHRLAGFVRDVAYDWRNFWLDVADYRAERKASK